MSKPVVLHLTSLTSGGAGQYTMGIHQNMIRDGYDSYVCMHGDQLIFPSGEGVVIHHKRASIISRIKRYLIKQIINCTGGVGMKYAPYNLFEYLDFYDPNDLLKVLPQTPTHIMVHWVSGYANAKYVRTLQEITGAKVNYWMIDEACLSGGCHYPWNCKGYKMGCEDCPMTKSGIVKSVVRKNFFHKQHFISQDAEVVLPTEMDRIRMEQSEIWKGHKWHKMIEIVNEEVFCPIDDVDTLKEQYGIPKDKRIILFGSANLAEERKGMKVLIDALKSVYRNDVHCVIIGSNDVNINLPTTKFGWVDIPTLANMYRIADVFVCPSLEDSGPQMINQSIMSGTPVVAFEMGVALDIVKTGETGYLAKWNDAVDLARGIEYILDMPKDVSTQMKRNCRDLALKTYSREIQNEIIKSLLV